MTTTNGIIIQIEQKLISAVLYMQQHPNTELNCCIMNLQTINGIGQKNLMNGKKSDML